MMMNLMTILVKKVFISSKPTFVYLLCPPLCGPFSIQESAAGGLSYKVKKEPSRRNHRNGTGLKHRFVDINKIHYFPNPGTMYVNNNLSNAGITTVKKITDLYAIKKSGFYCYDAGASNAPMSSRGGMVIANYLSDAWISLNVVPYALSKIYTNSKYNSTWTGWSELASKDDLATKLELVATDFLPLTAATIQPNNYTYFIFNPSLPSGYILVGACLKDTNALARKVVPVYCNASSSNGTHRINLQLANTSNDVVSITADMAIAFYLFVRKK